MHRSTQNQEDEALAFGEVAAPSSMTAASPGSVIQFRPRTAAAMPWSDDASSLDDDVFELGELAVQFMGNFVLPRLRVLTQDLREGAYRDPGSSDR